VTCRTRTRVNSKLKLALLSVVEAEPLEEKSAEARASPATEGVEKEKALRDKVSEKDQEKETRSYRPGDRCKRLRACEDGRGRCRSAPFRLCNVHERL
jgi:hypothetical protein